MDNKSHGVETMRQSLKNAVVDLTRVFKHGFQKITKVVVNYEISFWLMQKADCNFTLFNVLDINLQPVNVENNVLSCRAQSFLRETAIQIGYSFTFKLIFESTSFIVYQVNNFFIFILKEDFFSIKEELILMSDWICKSL